MGKCQEANYNGISVSFHVISIGTETMQSLSHTWMQDFTRLEGVEYIYMRYFYDYYILDEAKLDYVGLS